jgi:hypothetical protein
MQLAWAATGAWHGDLKLFARIAEKAIEEVRACGQRPHCRIEFEVRDDLERFGSVREMIDLVPASTLRSFHTACIRVAGAAMKVEVRMGRTRSPLKEMFHGIRGVAVEVRSEGGIEEEALTRTRDGVARVVARGGFRWARKPARGLDPDRRHLESALNVRTHARRINAQAFFISVAALLLPLADAVEDLVQAPGEDAEILAGLLEQPLFIPVFFTATQAASYLLTPFIFPAIEIAGTTPGRRFLQVIGRSGLVTAAVGVLVKALFES